MSNIPGIRNALLALALLAMLCFSALAQEPSGSDDTDLDAKPAKQAPLTEPADTQPAADGTLVIKRRRPFFRFITHRILKDQKVMWKAPFEGGAASRDFGILAGVTAVLVATDRRTSGWVSQQGSMPPMSRVVSLAAFSSLGISAAFYAVGSHTGDRRATETGLLTAEALMDSAIVTGVIKNVARRSRPNTDDGRGGFLDGGMSFPSGHASMAWSVATVVSYEYRSNKAIRIAAIAGAIAVSAARYGCRAHFLSEVVAGGAIGFYTGRFVFKEHHPELDLPPYQDPADEDPQVINSGALPRIAPYTDPRTHSYGLALRWSF